MALPMTSPKAAMRFQKENKVGVEAREPQGTASASKEIVAKTDTEARTLDGLTTKENFTDK